MGLRVYEVNPQRRYDGGNPLVGAKVELTTCHAQPLERHAFCTFRPLWGEPTHLEPTESVDYLEVESSPLAQAVTRSGGSSRRVHGSRARPDPIDKISRRPSGAREDLRSLKRTMSEDEPRVGS